MMERSPNKRYSSNPDIRSVTKAESLPDAESLMNELNQRKRKQPESEAADPTNILATIRTCFVT